MFTKREKVSALVKDTPIPKMFWAKQIFENNSIPAEEIPGLVREGINRENTGGKIKAGQRIAIAVGSRGICNQTAIVRTIVECVKERGAHPFIVPGMGCHGGATAEGQREVLDSLGFTEETMGCPILCTMETVVAGRNPEGKEIFLDRYAAEADGIILSCRVKPHTAFRGKYESGILKMMAIGLAKQKGAERTHDEGVGNLAKNVYQNGMTILKNYPVLFAVAMVENAYDQTCVLNVVPAEEVEETEPRMLEQAFANMPRLLPGSCDVLVVDRVGKNISGEGMDPNISGRFILPQYASGGADAQKVTILGLTPETHGNCHGICNADVVSQQVVDEADFEAFYINSITSTVLTLARIPLIMANHRECIQVCIRSLVETDKLHPRVIRVQDTLHLEHILLSEAYYEEVKARSDMEIESEPFEMSFDEGGNLF